MSSDATCLDGFNAACASDDLELVQSMFEEWRLSPNPSPSHAFHHYPVESLDDAFDAAVKKRSASVAKNLFQQEFRVNQPSLSALVRRNFIQVVQALVEAGWDVNQVGGHLGTALARASCYGSVELVKWLLEHGVDPNNHTWGVPSSILEVVTYWGDVEKVRLLLDHGAQLHDTHALHSAAAQGHVAAAALLLDRGADINRADAGIWEPSNGTALPHAARAGQLAAVALLLAHGADPSARDGRGRTARDIAVEHNHGDVAAILADD